MKQIFAFIFLLFIFFNVQAKPIFIEISNPYQPDYLHWQDFNFSIGICNEDWKKDVFCEHFIQLGSIRILPKVENDRTRFEFDTEDLNYEQKGSDIGIIFWTDDEDIVKSRPSYNILSTCLQNILSNKAHAQSCKRIKMKYGEDAFPTISFEIEVKTGQ